MDMGARRYARRFFASQNYTARQIKMCQHSAASKIQSIASVYRPFKVQSVYGTSGTIRTLAEIVSGFHKHDDATHLLRKELEAALPKLVKAVKEESLPETVEKERKETLVAGAIVLIEVMSALKIRSLRVCPSALREGIIYDRVETSGRLPSHPIQASANAMVKRFNLDREQIKRVSTTAELIFKQYSDELKLNSEAHRLLRAACQLHEIGLSISHKKIHLHGNYIITHSNMTGITQRQQQILAATVRFHRKAKPTPKHMDLKIMREKDIHTTIALAAILRMASALNRTKDGHAAQPRFEEKKKTCDWVFDDLSWCAEHEICIWNATQEKGPLNKLLSRPVRLN